MNIFVNVGKSLAKHIVSNIDPMSYIDYSENAVQDVHTTVDDIKTIVSQFSNYRPIAIATITSKLLESVLLLKCSDYLTTCDNQFGFKASHGTDMCIYTLKEFIDYYKCRGTTVYVTFLNASKAFDRLNYLTS